MLTLIAEGLSNQQISVRLFIAVSTVKSYVNAIFKKLGVESRTRAVAKAHPRAAPRPGTGVTKRARKRGTENPFEVR